VAGGGSHVLLAKEGGDFRTLYHKWIPEALLLEICGLYLRIGKWYFFEGETELYEIRWDRGNRIIQTSDGFAVIYQRAVISKITMDMIRFANTGIAVGNACGKGGVAQALRDL
jgi:hypothetical protein